MVSASLDPRASASPLPLRAPVALLRATMEGVVLTLVVLAPWAFGAVHALTEAVLFAGVALLLCLWAARILLERRSAWPRCPVLLCLAGMFLVGTLQLVPLSAPQLGQLSPATLDLDQRLRPAEHESVADEPIAPFPRYLSLNPGGTRFRLLELLAALALFAVVRFNLATPACLRRLAVVALVNGALLSLFALVQFFTSPPLVLYWTYPCHGQAFGPFICRNNFGCYVNLCIGLGLGLLLSARPFRPTPRTPWGGGASAWVQTVLNDPAVLWTAAALALASAGVVCSLSRGACVALLVGLAVAATLWFPRARNSGGLGVLLLLAVAVAALVAWFGFDAVRSRLGSVPVTDLTGEPRYALWVRVLPLTLRFPVFGTGLTTFDWIEPLSRGAGDPDTGTYGDAHNEYLQFAIEGGWPTLLLALAGIVFVYRAGGRALASPHAALALGALVAFTTLVIHNAVDFGLHIPAIVFLASVVAAQLTGLADPPPAPDTSSRGPVGAAAVAVTALAVAVLLVREGWRYAEAERCHLAAARCRTSPDADTRARECHYLEAATAYVPDSALYEVDLTEAYHEACGPDPAADDPRAADYRLRVARHALRARDLCPLLPDPQVRLAAVAPLCRRADPPDAYLERALFLRPNDPQIWFAAGVEDFDAGRRDRACAKWRHSLELSDRYLADILDRCDRAPLSPAEVLHSVLPDRPALLYAAGKRADSHGTDADPCYLQALALLDRQPALDPADLLLKARLLHALGRGGPAIAAYEAAVGRLTDPEAFFELATLLVDQNRLAEADHYLSAALALAPAHPGARALRDRLDAQNP